MRPDEFGKSWKTDSRKALKLPFYKQQLGNHYFWGKTGVKTPQQIQYPVDF